MEELLKNNKKNTEPFKFNIKMFVFLIINLLILFILFFFTNKIIMLLYATVIIIIQFFINNTFYKQKNKIQNDLKNLFNITGGLFENSSQLMNSIYTNFSNCFFLLKDLLYKKEKNNDDIPKQEIINKSDELEEFISFFTALDKTNKINFKIQKYKELIIKLNSFNYEIENFKNEVTDQDIFLKKDIMKIHDVYKNKDFFQNLIIEFEYYSEIISEFTVAFVSSSKSVAVNLSKQILNIKGNITKFINNIKKWENDFFDKQSKINFDVVIENYKIQNEQLNDLYKHIEKNNSNLDDKIQNIIKMVENIFNNINSIENIAEKINMLAINASIVSSRGQKSSKGFKVIASEIKSLANYTKSFINNTILLIRDTKDIAIKTAKIFKDNSQKLSDQIKNNRSHLKIFYEMLETYYTNFNSMFSSVTNLTEEIKSHIDKFNVLIQHYDIEEQEMGNLRKIIQDFLHNNKNIMHKITEDMNEDRKKEILQSIIYYIEKIISTKMENDILLTIKKKHHLVEENIEEITKKIEFF